MKSTTQPTNRAYQVGDFYVKNPIYNPELNEFVYELTTDVNDCHLMTEEVAKYLHKMNGEGQIRIINTLNQKL